MRIRLWFKYTTLLLVLASCNPNEKYICTEEARAGLNVYVNDSETIQILQQEVTVWAVMGSYQEVLIRPSSDAGPFSGAFERPGIYSIITSKPGYINDTIQPVVVRQDECHVIPEVIYVRLKKQ